MANGRDRDPGDQFCAAPEDLQCNPQPQQPHGRRATSADVDALLNHGHEHDARNEAGYAYSHDDVNGTTFGAGLRHQGENVTVDGPNVNFGAGHYYNRDGELERGIHAQGGLIGVNAHDANGNEIEGHAMTAEGGVWDDGNTFNVGAGVDVAGASAI